MTPTASGQFKGIAVSTVPWHVTHPFTPAANPRIQTCVRCGRASDAPVHSEA